MFLAKLKHTLYLTKNTGQPNAKSRDGGSQQRRAELRDVPWDLLQERNFIPSSMLSSAIKGREGNTSFDTRQLL